MKWSHSSAIKFWSCERKWYFASKYASYRTADTARRNAAFLKDAATLDEWKGNIVDTVISKFVHREKKYEVNPALDDYINEARELSLKQFTFSQQRRWENMKTKTEFEENGEFLILAPQLFEQEVLITEKRRIWEEIKKALEIYFEDENLMDQILLATDAFTQYPLHIKRQGITLDGKPDLLLFFADQPPLIIDWKVYRDSTFSHKQQLMIYAFMLAELDPIPDKLPKNIRAYTPMDYRICEYQLLTGEKRFYSIDEQDIHDTEEFINETIYRMKKKHCHLPPTKLKADDFRQTHNPATCMTCNFKSICWQ